MKRVLIIMTLTFLAVQGICGSEVEKANPVLVTAERVPMSRDSVTSSVTVIPAARIAGIREESAAEVLRDVPGLIMVQSGTPGANTTAFLRGANSAQSLVLIDGIEVNSPTVGSFDFAHLMTDNIQQIEVIRGPLSTLYGSEAMGGVVNIITRKGPQETGATFEVEGGSRDSGRFFAGAWGSKDRFDYAVNGSHTLTEGEFDNDAYENTSGAVNLGAALFDDLRVEVVTRGLRARKEIQDFGLISPDPNRVLRTEFELAAFKMDHWIHDSWEQKLTLSLVHERVTDRDPLNPGEAGLPLDTRIMGNIRTVDYQHHYYWGPVHTLIAGFEYEASQGKNVTIADPLAGDFSFKEDVDNVAGYFQDQIWLWDRLRIVPGFRVDNHSIFDTEISPRIAAALQVLEATRVRAGWAKGFRAPSINELFFPGFGNPDLDSEKSRGWEAGIEQTFFSGNAGVEAVYFRNDFDDLIDFEVISTDPFEGRANNIAEATIQGLELTSFVKPFRDVELSAGWTRLDAENDLTGASLLRRPDDSGFIQADVKRGGVNVAVRATLVGSRPDFDKELAGYVKLDAAVSYRIDPHWTPYVRAENLLDDEYEEASGFPAAGFLVFAGLKGEF